MRSCKEISKLVSESLDHDLPFMQRMEVRMHLMMCKMCRIAVSQAQFIRRALKAYGTKPTEPLPDEAKDRIKQALEKQSEE